MNFVVLRMISFHADDEWAQQEIVATKKQSDGYAKTVRSPVSSGDVAAEKDKDVDATAAAAERSVVDVDEEILRSIRVHRSNSEYCFVNYMSYCIYAPLYMAGMSKNLILRQR